MDTSNWDTLELTSTDPCRTTIIYKDLSSGSPIEKIIYTVRTDERGSRPITVFADRIGRVIAELEWHLRMSDKLSMHGREMKSVGKWLKCKKERGTKEHVYSFKCSRGTEYSWKRREGENTLQLYSNNDTSDLLARFNPRDGSTLTYNRHFQANIQICPQAKRDLDEIIVSMLLIEKARRFGGNAGGISAGGTLLILAAS